MRSEPERWASMRSAASRAAAAQPSEAERRKAVEVEADAELLRQLRRMIPRYRPPLKVRLAGAARTVKVFLAILLVLGWFGIISAFDKDPIASFLLLLVGVGGPVCFMYVLAWFPETRLGKVCQDILTFLAMFGGGGRG